MSPLRRLRSELKRSSNLKGYSTQASLAQLLGCSESLIRAVESGRVPMSAKLAAEISQRFGPPVSWLRQKEVDPDDSIPVGDDPMGLYDFSSVPVSLGIMRGTGRLRRHHYIQFRTRSLKKLLYQCPDADLDSLLDDLEQWVAAKSEGFLPQSTEPTGGGD